MITIYTDGSCRKNAIGGFGVVAFNEKNEIIHFSVGEYLNTTNNEMELTAIIEACEYAEMYPDKEFLIYSDSQYCVNSINNWMYNWAANDWKTSQKKEVKNLSKMKTLYRYFSTDFFNCQIEWIRGHEWNKKGDAHIGNELADALATGGISKFIKIVEDNDIVMNINKTC